MKKNQISNNNEETQDYTKPLEKISINRFKTKEGKQGFKVRVLSTIVMLFMLVLFVSTGAIYTYNQRLPYIEIAAYASFVGCFFLIICSTFEMNRATGFKKWWQQVITIILVLFAFLYPINHNLYQFDFYLLAGKNLATLAQPWIFPIIMVGIFLVYLIFGLLDQNIGLVKSSINFMMTLILIIAYKALTIACLSLQGSQTLISFNTVVWIWIMVIFADSFAYIGGMTWGKTKLAPVISPKKTWEGAAFGLSLAFAAGLIYALLFYFFAPDYAPFTVPMASWTTTSGKWYPILIYILFSLIFPIISLFGDLLYSWVKRVCEIKDFSKMIPGHGGVLDRMDSVTFSWAILFFIIAAFIW